MEYLPGNLKEYMSQYGVFNEKAAKDITEQILQGVHVLHENRIMHRDIKPEVWPIVCRVISSYAEFWIVSTPTRISLLSPPLHQ